MKKILVIILFLLFCSNYSTIAKERNLLESKYSIANQNIEFSRVGNERFELNGDWVKVSSYDGKQFLISRNDLITSNDIKYIQVKFKKDEVDKINVKIEKEDYYIVEVHFKKNSYEKIKKISEQHLNREFALVKNHIVLKTGIIMDVFMKATQMSRWNESEILMLLEGMKRK